MQLQKEGLQSRSAIASFPIGHTSGQTHAHTRFTKKKAFSQEVRLLASPLGIPVDKPMHIQG